MVTRAKEVPLVSLDPKGTEASKVGRVLGGVPGPVSVPPAHLLFVSVKGTKESKAWRAVQATRVQRGKTESVPMPVSLATVRQVNLACLAPRDPEVCPVSRVPKDQRALRATQAVWDPPVFPDTRGTKENKGPTGWTGPRGRRARRGSRARWGRGGRGVPRARQEPREPRGRRAHLGRARPASTQPLPRL